MLDYSYKEIECPSIGFYKEKGSKFIAYSYPIYSRKEVRKRLQEVKKLEHAARHHCYAYALEPDRSIQRVNDDGEPSYTAGKPILGQILSNNLTNILIVVTRYFGGVKLGVPGLINAYKAAAYNAISQAEIITKIIQKEYEVIFKYAQMNDVMRIIKQHDLKIIDTDFRIECKLKFTVAKDREELILNMLQKNHKLTIKHIENIQ